MNNNIWYILIYYTLYRFFFSFFLSPSPFIPTIIHHFCFATFFFQISLLHFFFKSQNKLHPYYRRYTPYTHNSSSETKKQKQKNNDNKLQKANPPIITQSLLISPTFLLNTL
eukprot:UN02441